jgi:putative peptidoglycan lipid II flippase
VPQDASLARPGARRIPAVAALLAASVLFSRVLGWVREMVLAYHLGTTPQADAYRAAFQLPDLLNHFLAGGALSIAFLPLYTRVRQERGPQGAQALLALVLGTLTALTGLATALLFWQAEALVALQFPRFSPETQALTVRLTRIVLPAQIFFVAGGILSAALMAHDRFRQQALAPLLYNAGIIAGGLLLGGALGAEGFAWGALAGAVAGPFLAPLFETRRTAGLRLGFRVAPLQRDFLRYLALAAPLMLGVSLLTVDEWYDRWFGGLLAEGTVAALAYARQLMLLPVAVVGQAVATAALPALAQLHAEGRRAELDRVLLLTLRAALALAVLAGGAAFALAEPAVALLYQRGAFTAADTARVAALLGVFACAVPAWVTQQIAVRGFYARGDTWRPMLLGSALALAAVPLYLALGPRFGGPGLAAAGALAMSVAAAATLALLRQRHGGPALLPLAAAFARALAVAAPAAGAAAWLAARPGRPAGALLGGAALFVLIAVPGIWLAGDEATREVLRRLFRRLRRARVA